MVTHFLITRFNIQHLWESTKNGDSVLTTSWLEHRFKLFETYCLPSVRQQTNQDFHWLVFFDPFTPERFKKKISELAEAYPVFCPVFIIGKWVLQKTLKEEIERHLQPGTEYVITSRVDNDDLLHQGYTARIRELFEPVHRSVIDLRRGYQVDIREAESAARNRFKRFNPFVSLVERREEVETVFAKMHFEWKEGAKVIADEENRWWVELIHDKNKLNEIDLAQNLLPHFDWQEFGLPSDFRPE